MKSRSVGRNIRKYRIMQELKQDELAEKAGLSTNYIGMVERGEKIPSLDSFIRIINALDVSADVILCDELNHGFQVKNSILDQKLDSLTVKDRERVYAVIDTLIKYS